jgi:hypothetical protein
LGNIAKNNLEYCHYDDSYYDIDTSVIWQNKILAFNGIDKNEFFENIKEIMDKSVIRIKTLVVVNLGKTRGLVDH